MSGAEALLVIGIIANAAAIARVCNTIVERSIEFRRFKEVPRAFCSLRVILPLINLTLEKTKQSGDAGKLEAQTCEILTPVMHECKKRLDELETKLQHMIPADDASKLRIFWKETWSLTREKEINDLANEIMRLHLLIQQAGAVVPTLNEVLAITSRVEATLDGCIEERLKQLVVTSPNSSVATPGPQSHTTDTQSLGNHTTDIQSLGNYSTGNVTYLGATQVHNYYGFGSQGVDWVPSAQAPGANPLHGSSSQLLTQGSYCLPSLHLQNSRQETARIDYGDVSPDLQSSEQGPAQIEYGDVSPDLQSSEQGPAQIGYGDVSPHLQSSEQGPAQIGYGDISASSSPTIRSQSRPLSETPSLDRPLLSSMPSAKTIESALLSATSSIRLASSQVTNNAHVAKRAYGNALATLSAMPSGKYGDSSGIPPALLVRVLCKRTTAHLGLTLVTSPPEPELAAANADNNAAQVIASRTQDYSLEARVRLGTAAVRTREVRVAEKRGGTTARRVIDLRETALGHYEAVAASLKDRCQGVVDWDTRAKALLGCEHVGRKLGRRTERWVREALTCVEEARRVGSAGQAEQDAEGVDLEATAEQVQVAMCKMT